MEAKIIKVFLVFLILMNANRCLYAQASVEICAGQKGFKYRVLGDKGSIFHWKVQGGQIVSDAQDDTVTINWGNEPGKYSIAVYEEKINGCLGNSKEIDVNLQPYPLVDLGVLENICEGEQIEFNASFGPDAAKNKYLWQDGTNTATYVAKRSGIYWAEVTNLNGCSYRDSVVLVVNPLPIINLGNDTTLCYPDELVIDAGSNGKFFEWSNGENSQTIIAHENDDKIWVRVVDQNGCSGTDTIQILKCLYREDLYIPKAFSPSGGTVDSYWKIGGSERYPSITVKIYDRWGILIYESKRGYPIPWDGKSFNGKDLPMDAYYYIINKGDGSKDIVGSVTLIR